MHIKIWKVSVRYKRKRHRFCIHRMYSRAMRIAMLPNKWPTTEPTNSSPSFLPCRQRSEEVNKQEILVRFFSLVTLECIDFWSHTWIFVKWSLLENCKLRILKLDRKKWRTCNQCVVVVKLYLQKSLNNLFYLKL